MAGIDWLNGEEGQEIRDKISEGMTAVMNFLIDVAKGFADILHFFTTGNEIGVVSQIVEMYQKIMEWFSSLPGKIFDSLPEFAQEGLKALGFSPEAAYDPSEVSAGGNTRADLTEELDEAESKSFDNRSIPPTVIVAPQSSNTNVNSNTTNITASSGPVRDPSHLKQRGRGSHL